MKITNKLNLPSAFVNMASEEHEVKEKHYSVTEILSGVREIILMRRHREDVTQDVSDMINLVFGSAIHHVLEQADKENITEKRLEVEIQDGYYLTGKFDLFNPETATIEDYKSSTVWKVIFGDFEDWRKQGLMYAWLCRQKGIIVEKLRFHALLKDWTRAKAKYDKSYPPHQVFTWEYRISTSDMLEIEEFIRKRFKYLIHFEKSENPPICTDDERWYTGTKYAAMARNKKRAIKVCDTESEAKEVEGCDFVVERQGENKKCEEYCLVNGFCSFYQKLKKGEI